MIPNGFVLNNSNFEPPNEKKNLKIEENQTEDETKDWKRAFEAKNEQFKMALGIIESLGKETERSEKMRKKLEVEVQKSTGMEKKYEEMKKSVEETKKMRFLEREVDDLMAENSELEEKLEECHLVEKSQEEKIQNLEKELKEAQNSWALDVQDLEKENMKITYQESKIEELENKLEESLNKSKSEADFQTAEIGKLKEENARLVQKVQILEKCMSQQKELAEKDHLEMVLEKNRLLQEIKLLKPEPIVRKVSWIPPEPLEAEKLKVQGLEAKLNSLLEKSESDATKKRDEIERWRRRNTELVQLKKKGMEEMRIDCQQKMEELKVSYKSAFDAKLNMLKETILEKNAAEMKMKQEIKILTEKIQNLKQKDISKHLQITENNQITEELIIIDLQDANNLNSTSSE